MVERVKQPLVDSFGRVHTYLRVSVTDRCNLRCQYCMPPQGIEWTPRQDILRFEEIVRIARVFAQMGISKVRLTGGEPLVRHDIVKLAAATAAIPGIQTLAMTTNGVHLADQLPALSRSGISQINISLDTLQSDRFEKLTHRNGHEQILAAINAAVDSKIDRVSVNCVVMGGVNDDELCDFVELARTRPVNVRFIEFMPFGGNDWDPAAMVPYVKMRRIIQAHYELQPLAEAWDPAHVSKDFSVPGFVGTIGFITSMTEDFCGGCNRVRLTADGAIKPCLHHPAEVSLRDAIRDGCSDRTMEMLIRQAMQRKPSGHAPMDELSQVPNRTMIQIGG